MSNGRFLIYLERHKKAVGESTPALPTAAAEPTSEREKPTHSEEKYTLEEAFDYFNIPDGDEPSQCELNNERCVRAAGFLLHYCSEHGNENVHGFIAHGLGHALEECASKIAHVKMYREWLRRQASRG